jgi:hypothetical protein
MKVARRAGTGDLFRLWKVGVVFGLGRGRRWLGTLGFVALLLCAAPMGAAGAGCPFAGQRPMLVVQLFFGQSVGDGGVVSDQDWTAFVADTVTPHFPDGLSVYDAYGQWMNAGTKQIGRERTKVIVVAAANSARTQADVREVIRVYRQRFRQQSVGVISEVACAAF